METIIIGKNKSDIVRYEKYLQGLRLQKLEEQDCAIEKLLAQDLCEEFRENVLRTQVILHERMTFLFQQA